ncbi:MAG: histidine phosphatase family protein [Candidatus Poribacteria bacterium]
MPLTLYLLRHGESVANVERIFAARKIDPPLSDLGIQQATMQAKSLRKLSSSSQFEFKALYASPLRRAKHTAEIVGEWCGLEPIFSEDLMEVDVGVLDGESQEDDVKWEMYERVIKKWEQGLHHISFQGGESLNDIEFRFGRFLKVLENKRTKPAAGRSEAVREDWGFLPSLARSHILVVGHCLLFMAVIWLFCRKPKLRETKQTRPEYQTYCENHTSMLEDWHMGRGHLSIISKDNDKFRLIKFNLSPEETSTQNILSKNVRR